MQVLTSIKKIIFAFKYRAYGLCFSNQQYVSYFYCVCFVFLFSGNLSIWIDLGMFVAAPSSVGDGLQVERY